MYPQSLFYAFLKKKKNCHLKSSPFYSLKNRHKLHGRVIVISDLVKIMPH